MRVTELAMRNSLVILGASHLALSAWAAFDPGSFVRAIANFGPQNVHLVHDFAACAATFGAGMIIAAGVPSWRPAALALAALWTGLHAMSHIADIADAQPAVVGPIEAVLLTLLTGILASLAYLSSSKMLKNQDPQR